MGWFRNRDVYDRRRILREAREAQRRKRHKQAVTLLRRILVVEPQSPEIHGLIAPSLAARKQTFDAWESYTHAAKSWMRDGRKQQAVDLYRDATQRLPQHFPAWKTLAALERSLGKPDAARQTLEAALVHFRGRSRRPERIALLRRLVELAPKAGEAQLLLAVALAKAGRKHEALHLLAELSKRVEPEGLRRIRRCQWEIEPSLTHSWLWLRASLAH